MVIDFGPFTLNKLGCSKQALIALNSLAWDNGIRLGSSSLVIWAREMINRDCRGYSYSIVRGEILRFFEDELQRKRLTRMLSLIKNES